MKTYKVFELGSDVRLVSDVDAVIKSVQISAMGIEYLVYWWDEGERFEDWVMEEEIVEESDE